MNFLLFGGEEYYAHGGANDLIDAYGTLFEAVEEANKIMGKRFAMNVDDFREDPKYCSTGTIEWVQILDLELNFIVFAAGGPHGDSRIHVLSDEEFKTCDW